MSEVIKLLDRVWKNANSATAHSWERLNHSMRDALTLAVGSGFTWKAGDMAAIASGKYNFGYWSSDSTEWIYALAIETENLTAAKSYEAWKKREAFIADDVTFHASGGFIHTSSANRGRERLAVGFEFQWKGLKVKVTSFSEDGSYLTACSYKPRKEGYSEKIDKRFKITREDIFAERAERKERTELIARLTTAACAEDADAATITKALGAKTKLELATVPLEKIRAVADKYAPKPPKGSVPVITKAHRSAALKAGACRTSLRPYPIGTPLTSLDENARSWVKFHLPELYAKYFAKAGAA